MGAAVGVGLLAAVFGVAPASATAPSADLSITVRHTPSSPLGGTNLRVTMTAHNDGPDPAAAVIVAMSTPYPLRFVSAINPRGTCTNSSSTQTVICKVGDLASGASADVQVDVLPLASGVYQLPVATSSETADPDTADRSATETVIVQRGPSQAERYVPAVFQLLLKRAPGADAAFWIKVFETERYQNGIYEVPLGIMSSVEYRRLQVKAAYARILGRTPSAADLSYWANRIGQGLSYAGLDVRLLTSGEFGRTIASRSGLVAAIFKAVLHRNPSQAELDALMGALNGGATLASITGDLFHTTEAYDLVLKDRYQRTFARAPTQLERYYWQSEVRKGVTPEALWAGLLGGFEYTNKFPPTYDNSCCGRFAKPKI